MADYKPWNEALDWEIGLIDALERAVEDYAAGNAPTGHCMKQCIHDSWVESLEGSRLHAEDVKDKELSRPQVRTYLRAEVRDLERLCRLLGRLRSGSGPVHDLILRDWILNFHEVIDSNECLLECTDVEMLAEAAATKG